MRFTLSTLLFLLFFIACNNQSSTNVSPELIETGEAIIRFEPTDLRYSLVLNKVLEGQQPLELTNNSAKIEINGKQEIGFFIPGASATFIALPNDTVDLRIVDGKPVIETNRAGYDEYLEAKVSVLTESITDLQNRMKLDAPEFLARENDFHNALLANLDTFKDKMLPSIVASERAAIFMQKASTLIQYPNYYSYINQGAVPSDDLRGSLEALMMEEEAKDLQNPAFIDIFSQWAMSKEAEALMAKGEQVTSDNYVEFQLNSVRNHIVDEEVREIALVKMLMSAIEFDIQKAKDTFELEKEMFSVDYQQKLEARFAEWNNLMPGNPAPNFITVDMEGKQVMLSDLRGKYVYIDVWATWCGPCKQEIPFLKELDEEYKNEDIVFMSVSIDETQAPWKTMVQDEELKGLQVFIDGAWNSTLVKDYKIAGIPRFMLIDPEGNIVTVQAARPSGSIKKTIDELLAQS